MHPSMVINNNNNAAIIIVTIVIVIVITFDDNRQPYVQIPCITLVTLVCRKNVREEYFWERRNVFLYVCVYDNNSIWLSSLHSNGHA